MKITEIRKASEEEVLEKLSGYRQELFNLRWQTASNQNQNPKRIREVKRNIARLLTIVSERNRKEA